jgi:hypothetical protein
MRLRVARKAFSIAAVTALGTALGGAGASPALADGTAPAYPGSVVHVSVSGPLQAGKVLTITATGANTAQTALGGPALDFGLDLIVVDPQILKGPCEVSEQKELTDITNVPDGGRLLNFDDLNEGSSGPFRISQPYEPAGFGPLLVCAYSKYVTDDAAYASTQVQIKPADKPAPPRVSPRPSAPPRSLARPMVRLSHGRLTCTRGRWSNRPTQFTYRWKIGRGRFGSARTKGRVALSAHRQGKAIVCSVTASNARGSARATSRARTFR